MYGPVLSGKTKYGQEVRLRPPRHEDAGFLVEALANLDITHTLSNIFPPALESEYQWIESMAVSDHDVVWIIEHGKRLMPAGITGIHQINPIHRNAVSGTFIAHQWLWGKGIGSVAMRLRTEFAFNYLGLHKLNSSFIEGNEGSRIAQERAGFNIVGCREDEIWRDGRWWKVYLTEILARDWREANPKS